MAVKSMEYQINRVTTVHHREKLASFWKRREFRRKYATVSLQCNRGLLAAFLARRYWYGALMAEVSYAEAMTRRWKEATNVTRCYKYDTVVKQSMPLKTSRNGITSSRLSNICTSTPRVASR
ncbi:uncharacterized protein LOC111272277 isoform X1 [Varroa jacobsoni]|uniref:uncharacterized protein LOC111272277 isoform X1 n=1 Tax=Varroa jacobsoni TaxID=62625 RepID=UPI000BF329FD|nr:uncharacterized protein LOC111272277 isoform X1 [Varroa jacobsoni]